MTRFEEIAGLSQDLTKWLSDSRHRSTTLTLQLSAH
jgi:hypothetical protein